MNPRCQKGVSLIELLISLTILLICVTALAKMMIENARINKAQQMTAEVQANARNCLTMVVQRLRSAGWDPMNVGVGLVALDADMGDDVSEIEVFADLDEDGLTDGVDEQVLIRHASGQVAWRRTNDTNDPFIVLATNISNDADGDGSLEPMFVPDSTTEPSLITVRITAQSPVPDPMSGEFIRYTVASDVFLRKSL
jgi:prepilin-type N-terminal cleavage/methylation domain-containing protein